ncbi:Spy/CpxP family protein refolding chaperone [Kamptonema formosum]|uniref:Spy/CpxP family protein refolding chaperone n=1 Tax=Kamptonema formosum TaxID=331992 RepID=UPI00034510A6|nr:Spy/CpxP family protein refolding chaperone [Oscillatoria sp. PCC 10802]
MLFRRVSVLAVLMLALGNAAALAQSAPAPEEPVAQRPGDDGPPGPPGRGPGELFEQLNLSQDQMQKMQQIQERYKTQMQQQQKTLRQAEDELRDLMAGTADQNQLREKHRQVQALREKMGELRFESLLEMREVLTPDQRRQMSELMQQRRPGMRNAPGRERPQPN